MALVAITGLPIIAVGHANKSGTPSLTAHQSTTIDAANEACHMVGGLYWEDGGSHTIDTTGSSSIQWRSGSTTFANAGTTFKVGIAPVDTATGPPTRATNVADVISFDVSASFTGGGGGVTTASWQTSVPTAGTKTIATADLIAVGFQMTARAGADSVLVQTNLSASNGAAMPSATDFTGGSYSNNGGLPNVVVVASDGTRGYIFGGFVASVGSTSQSWNNGSASKEYGNILRFPFPVTAFGIIAGNSAGGDCDFVLYSDPLGTPVAQRTISVNRHTIGATSAANELRIPFSSSYNLLANTDYAVIAKPSSVTSVSMNYKTYGDSNHQNSEPLGTSCYAINRSSGAFAAQNSNKDRFAIGLLVGAFEHGVQPTYVAGIV